MPPRGPHERSGNAAGPTVSLADLGVLVLAAGKSTRIAPVAGGRPKPLLSLAGKSVLAHNLAWLRSAGITAVWINLHHRPDEVRAEVAASTPRGLTVRYSHEETLLGTAGAWKHLAGELRGDSVVVYGDNLMRFDLAALHAQHRAAGVAATITLFDPARHANTGIAGGRVSIAEDGLVAAFHEGGTGTSEGRQYVNAGVYILNDCVSGLIGAGLQDFGRDVLPSLATKRQLAAHVIEPAGYCLGIDTPESLRVAEELIQRGVISLP